MVFPEAVEMPYLGPRVPSTHRQLPEEGRRQSWVIMCKLKKHVTRPCESLTLLPLNNKDAQEQHFLSGRTGQAPKMLFSRALPQRLACLHKSSCGVHQHPEPFGGQC